MCDLKQVQLFSLGPNNNLL